MNERIFTNARIVLGNEILENGTLHIDDGLIRAVESGRSRLACAIDLGGDLLLPGLVELHTDNLERHLMPRPKVSFPMRAAVQAHDAELAAAGITTVFDAVGVGDPHGDGFRARDQSDLLQALDQLEAARLLRCEHLIHVRCELPAPNPVELFEPYSGHRRLGMISLMDHTPGQRQWTDIEQARIYYTGKKGWSNAQFEAELRVAAERQSRFAAANRLWFADFARIHGVVLATHDDTTLAHVDEARAMGASLSEFPTTLAAARYAHLLGLRTVAGAPNVVRGLSHSGNVSATILAREGVLDALSSDYVPSSLLHAAWVLHRDADFSLPAAVRIASGGPAEAAGLDDRGSIAPGLRADLLRIRELEGHPVVREVYLQGVRTV